MSEEITQTMTWMKTKMKKLRDMDNRMGLKYLIGDSVSSYKESKYTGKSAQHSQLHENKQVANEIIEFLWSK